MPSSNNSSHARFWILLGVALASRAVGGGTARAQDVGNGLWQDYRYPASNPNWRREYERMVETWGENPAGLRPRYNSSGDMMWGSASPGGATPFGDQPFYTVSRWNPYVPRPVDWSGLEYSPASAPPETTTGNHAWYGPSTPGPLGDTPEEWREWEMNTPEGLRYREASGLVSPTSTARTGRAPAPLPAKEKTSLRQYFRTEPGKPGGGRWQERDARVPAEVSDQPAREEQQAGGLKEYVLNRPKGTGTGQTRPLRIVRPAPVSEPAPARNATSPQEHSGFTQYYMRTTPKTGKRHWEVKTKKPAEEP